jgi:acyl-CoA reductase-like NAD-dependent aldehyde dehydrogenase
MRALGGAKKNMIVLPDADIDMAADAAVSGSARRGRCMAVSMLVAVGHADDLVSAIQERLPKVVVGDGMNPDSEMGPLVTRAPRQGGLTSRRAPPRARGRHRRTRVGADNGASSSVSCRRGDAGDGGPRTGSSGRC